MAAVDQRQSDGGHQAREQPDVSEVYSPPRIAPMAKDFGMKPGWRLDLTTTAPDGRVGLHQDQPQKRSQEAARRDQAEDPHWVTHVYGILGTSKTERTQTRSRSSTEDPHGGRDAPGILLRALRDPDQERRLLHPRTSVSQGPARGDAAASRDSWPYVPGVIATAADQCRYGLTAVDERTRTGSQVNEVPNQCTVHCVRAQQEVHKRS